MALAGRRRCQERQHARHAAVVANHESRAHSVRGLCGDYAVTRSVGASAWPRLRHAPLRQPQDEVEQLGFAHEGEYGSLRWLQVPTSSEPVDLLSRDHLRVLADFNPTRDDLIPFLDILREGNVGRPILMRRPLVTYLVLPFTLRAVPAAVVFEQRDHVHAAIVIED